MLRMVSKGLWKAGAQMAYQNRYPVVAPHAGPTASSAPIFDPAADGPDNAAPLESSPFGQTTAASDLDPTFVETTHVETTRVETKPAAVNPYSAVPQVPAPVFAVPVAAAYATAPVAAEPYVGRRISRDPLTIRPTRDEMSRRITIFAFGIVQGLIIIRIVLLALDARAANGLVSAILNLSQVLVAPFDGILHTNALHSGGSALDVAAVVALVGWTILEGLVFASISLFRREPA
jgi:YGGT family